MGGIPLATVRTEDIIKEFNLELISGEDGVHRPVTTSDISRPGLEIAGFFTIIQRNVCSFWEGRK